MENIYKLNEYIYFFKDSSGHSLRRDVTHSFYSENDVSNPEDFIDNYKNFILSLIENNSSMYNLKLESSTYSIDDKYVISFDFNCVVLTYFNESTKKYKGLKLKGEEVDKLKEELSELFDEFISDL